MELLTVKEVAKKLTLSENTVYRMAAKREIPYIKFGYKTMRFDPVEIDKLIRKHQIPIKK